MTDSLDVYALTHVNRDTLLTEPSYVDNMTRELLLDLRRKADAAGVEIGDPIKLHLCPDSGQGDGRYTVHASAPVVGVRHCGPDGRHAAPQPLGGRPTSCPCGTVTRVPAQPPEPDRG